MAISLNLDLMDCAESPIVQIRAAIDQLNALADRLDAGAQRNPAV